MKLNSDRTSGMHLNQGLQKKNPHTAKITSQKIKKLDWKKIPRSTYFPSLVHLDQGSLNISSRGICIDFFGPPWAKAKSLICKKQLINNCKQIIYLKSVAVHN